MNPKMIEMKEFIERKFNSKVLEFSAYEIRTFLSVINEARTLTIDISEGMKENFIQNFYPNISSEDLSSVNNFISTELPAIIEVAKAVGIFYICALLTASHCDLSRYPVRDKDPIKYYSLKNPLVKFLPDLMYLLSFALRRLKKVIVANT